SRASSVGHVYPAEVYLHAVIRAPADAGSTCVAPGSGARAIFASTPVPSSDACVASAAVQAVSRHMSSAIFFTGTSSGSSGAPSVITARAARNAARSADDHLSLVSDRRDAGAARHQTD